MKSLLLTLIAIFSITALQAQKSWEAPLKAQLTKADQIASKDELVAVLGTIERIALTEKEEWLPNYYAAYYNVQNFWWTMQSDDQCSTCLEKMDNYLKAAEAADNNSEVMTLRSYYYTALLNVDPSKAPMYGPKAGGILQKAVAMDPNNARAQLLLGQNLYYTPEQFGGGLARAKPYLAKAEELLKNQKNDGLHPSWGQRDYDRVMMSINKTK